MALIAVNADSIQILNPLCVGMLAQCRFRGGDWRMDSLTSPVRRTGNAIFSARLRRNFSGIADTAFVQLGGMVLDVPLSTRMEDLATALPASFFDRPAQSPGRIASCLEIKEGIAVFLRRVGVIRSQEDPSALVGENWRLFRCAFENGVDDLVAVLLRKPSDASAALGFLSTIWPVLREDCLRDLTDTNSDVCDKAMLWMVASKIDVAILVMNAHGAMLRANAAAKHLLERETVLRRSPKGIRCINDQQTQHFRAALAECAASDPAGPGTVVFLDTVTPSLRIPATMSRFWYEGAATELVTVVMPSPPSSQRVEMLARAVGLTPAEARVASLLQMGLSNKDAARAAGLKEQSVSTYAKRVLNKLNVTSRAEMAQMLTWQAGGGGM
jgi:DNA-binding CsgD family transcriptional regulator